jgi:hypothetical protein
MRRPLGGRFGTRHDGSTQAPSDSYRGPGVRFVQQTHPSYACIKHSVAGLLTRLLPAYCQVNGIRRDCPRSHNSTVPEIWVGSDRIAYSSSRLEAKANKRPAQLKRCSNMDIRLNIEMRCARRQNDAANHHHRPTIVADPSQTDKRLSSIGVTWSTNALGGMFLTLWIAWLPPSHYPTVLRSPVNGSEAPMATVCYVQLDVMRATGTRRVPPVTCTSSRATPLYLRI